MAMSGPGRAAAVVRGTGRHDSDDDFPGEVRERLARHLRGHGMRFDPAGSITRLAGGLANRNYRTMVDGRAVVLRRPPDGQLPPGAYDMAREHRILASLGTTRDTAVERIFRMFAPSASMTGLPSCIAGRWTAHHVGEDLVPGTMQGGRAGRDAPVLPPLPVGWMRASSSARLGRLSTTVGRLTGKIRRRTLRDREYERAKADR